MLPVTSSNGKIDSAHTLPARISEEPEEVFSAAETPLGSGGNGKEIRHPLTNYNFMVYLLLQACMHCALKIQPNSGKVLREKTFVDGSQTSKLVKVFSLENFLLYNVCVCVCVDTLSCCERAYLIAIL